MNNITVLILSCANYSDLWSNNLYLFDRFWPFQSEIKLVSDGEGLFNLQKPDNLFVYDGNMSTRLLSALKSTKSDYILLTLDDYFLKKPVNREKINKLFEVITNNQFDYCRLYSRPKTNGKKIGKLKYKILPMKKVYELNFYPGIWKREALLKIIQEEEDIWKSEVRLTRRARELKMTAISVEDPNFFPFVDVIRKGKYLISAKKFLLKNGLYVSNRKTRTVKETISLYLQTFISRNTPSKVKAIIKQNLRKKGKIFYSDYENTNE